MLKIEKISKTFNPGTNHEKAALQGLSLHLLPGDFVTVIGSNGAGKSTLLNAISGSFFTDSGSIYLDGRNITFLPEYQRSRQIGRLFQDPMRGSAPHMTIEENLSLAAASGGWLSHVTRAEKAAFRGSAGHGPGEPDEAARGAAFRRPASGADAGDGHLQAAEAPAAG